MVFDLFCPTTGPCTNFTKEWSQLEWGIKILKYEIIWIYTSTVLERAGDHAQKNAAENEDTSTPFPKHVTVLTSNSRRCSAELGEWNTDAALMGLHAALTRKTIKTWLICQMTVCWQLHCIRLPALYPASCMASSIVRSAQGDVSATPHHNHYCSLVVGWFGGVVDWRQC